MKITVVLVMIRVACGKVTDRPENTVGLVGNSLTLKCAGTFLGWEKVNIQGPDTLITIQDRNYHNATYSLSTTPTGRYDLTIRSLQLEDGANYICKTVTDVTNYAIVHVIVFKDFYPTCTSNIMANNETVEGTYIGFSCKATFNGRISPLMKWTDGSGSVVQALNESSGGVTKYTIIIQMKASHNEQRFTCQTYFDPLPALPNRALNTPINDNAYSEFYKTQTLTVYYGPRSLQVKHNNDIYSPGENTTVGIGRKLSITADSNPSSRHYRWINESSAIIATDAFFTVTEDMLGYQSFIAEVCNSIPIPSPNTVCSNYSVSIMVTKDDAATIVGDVIGVLLCVALTFIVC